MMTQPVGVPQLVSRIIVPGRYRRAAGTSTSAGPNRKPPASRSRIAPKTLGESTRGRHNHSTHPLGATRANDSQSDRKPYSPIGGNGDCSGHDCSGHAWGDGGMRGDTTVPTDGKEGRDRSRTRRSRGVDLEPVEGVLPRTR